MFKRSKNAASSSKKVKAKTSADADFNDPSSLAQFGVVHIPDDDPELLAELSDLGWKDAVLESRSKSAPSSAKQQTKQENSKNTIEDVDLSALGIDISGIGMGSDDEEASLNYDEDFDENDPDLLGELDELGSSDDNQSITKETDHNESVPPTKNSSLEHELSRTKNLTVEERVTSLKQKALAYSKEGNKDLALEYMREARKLEQEVSVQKTLEVVQQLAADPKVTIISSSDVTPPNKPLPVIPSETLSIEGPLQKKNVEEKTFVQQENSVNGAHLMDENEAVSTMARVEAMKEEAKELMKQGKRNEAVLKMRSAKSFEEQINNSSSISKFVESDESEDTIDIIKNLKDQAKVLLDAGNKTGALEIMRNISLLQENMGTNTVRSACELPALPTTSSHIPMQTATIRSDDVKSQLSIQNLKSTGKQSQKSLDSIPSADKLDLCNGEIDALKLEAKLLLKQGKRNEALEKFKSAKDLEEKQKQLSFRTPSINQSISMVAQIDGLKLEAKSLLNRGKEKEAIEIFKSAMELESQYSRSSSHDNLFSTDSTRMLRDESIRSDLFTNFEEAVKVAMKAHIDRAKELLKVDKKAASEETQRAKELQTQLARLKEVKTIPGAMPPQWQWAITRRNRLRTFADVSMDEIELRIKAVKGLGDIIKGKGQNNAFVQYDLGYDKEGSAKGASRWFQFDCRQGANETIINHTVKIPLKRGKRILMAFQHRKATFEIVYKKWILSGVECIAKAQVPLNTLLQTCSIEIHAPLLNDARREVGGYLEIELRLQRPLAGDEIVVQEEKSLQIGEWPLLITGANPPGSFQQAHVPAPLPPQIKPQSIIRPPQSTPVPHPPQEVPPPTIQPNDKFSILTPEEISDPLAPFLMDSNNVLEDEISQARLASGDPLGAVRLSNLELKLQCLEGAVGGGELSLKEYCNMIEERMKRDRLLAVYLSKCGRMSEAKKVLRRVKLVEEELAGVPPEERS